MTTSTMSFLESSAYQYIEHRINYYEDNPEKAPAATKSPIAVLKLPDVQTDLAVPTVSGNIPIYDFKVFKRRLLDNSGIEVYFAVVCASERYDSKSEALVMQKMNTNDTLSQFVVAKLDDKSGNSNITVVYQLQDASILHLLSGGIYTGIVATAMIDQVKYIDNTNGGNIQTSYDSTTGAGK